MRCLFIPSGFSNARIPHFVQEVNNGIVLLDADTIEMSSHSLGEVVFALAAELCSSRHRGRLQADARLRQNPVAIRGREGSRCVESMFTAVPVQDVTIEGRPLKLTRE